MSIIAIVLSVVLGLAALFLAGWGLGWLWAAILNLHERERRLALLCTIISAVLILVALGLSQIVEALL